MIQINININKDGLTTSECRDLSESLEFFNTDDIISLLEGAEHSFEIGNRKSRTQVKVKRNY